ncbi:hypothetical protein SEA_WILLIAMBOONE_116 [Gordonia phage WilliamBoone]|nr:hypothetical protein SEA_WILLIAMBOONE_116 [Gordonia phage WilliamBoone]
MKKLLVTGTRTWTDREAIYSALSLAAAALGGAFDRESILLIEGECPTGGADIIARDIWWSQGRPVLGVPANWEVLGKRAGPERNQRMVDMMPDLCIAFLQEGSRGTVDCVARARKAGIPVREVWG